MTSGERKAPRKGFAGYEPGCESEILEFQQAAYPERPAASILPRWSWLFLESARRLAVEPMLWLYRRDDQLVAHQGAMPVELWVEGRTLTTGWFVETMAAESVRGSAVGPMLVRKALADLPLNLSLGQTAQMRDLQYALGWQRVTSLETYVFVCTRKLNLRRRLPPVAAEAAAWLLGVRNALKLRRALRGSHLECRDIGEFTHHHEALWERMQPTVRCAVRRNVSYLNWKYVARPDSQFILLELSTDVQPAAVAVLMTEPPGSAYPYSRGFIVELVMPLDQPRHIDAAVAACVRRLQADGVKTVTFYVANPAVEKQLKHLGFLGRGPRHELLVSTPAGDPDIAAAMTTAGNWYLTMGDSDADFYPG